MLQKFRQVFSIYYLNQMWFSHCCEMLSRASGELLCTGQRTELLEAIYQDVTKYTL